MIVDSQTFIKLKWVKKIYWSYLRTHNVILVLYFLQNYKNEEEKKYLPTI